MKNSTIAGLTGAALFMAIGWTIAALAAAVYALTTTFNAKEP